MKILVEQEGIDINAKNWIYFNNLIFQNNIWCSFKLFIIALMFASEKGDTEIVKIFVEKEGNDLNLISVFVCLKLWRLHYMNSYSKIRIFYFKIQLFHDNL